MVLFGQKVVVFGQMCGCIWPNWFSLGKGGSIWAN